jgi:hypothetical protein
MTTEEARQVKQDERRGILAQISSEIAAECRRIAREIENQQNELREDKILAAKMRLSNGYYESDLVIRSMSSSLLPIILPIEDR